MAASTPRGSSAGPARPPRWSPVGPGRMNVLRAPSPAIVAPNSAERNSEPLSVRTRPRRQPWIARSTATRWARALVRFADGFNGVVASSAQVYEEARSIAVYCQTRPVVPDRRPTWKQSKRTSSPRWSTATWRASGEAGRSARAGRRSRPPACPSRRARMPEVRSRSYANPRRLPRRNHYQEGPDFLFVATQGGRPPDPTTIPGIVAVVRRRRAAVRRWADGEPISPMCAEIGCSRASLFALSGPASRGSVISIAWAGGATCRRASSGSSSPSAC
jgi:hypothetical protein